MKPTKINGVYPKPTIEQLFEIANRCPCQSGLNKHTNNFKIAVQNPYYPFLVCTNHANDYKKAGWKVLTFNEYLATDINMKELDFIL